MNRTIALNKIQDPTQVWDIIIIGGGATGLGTALDAAARGFKTLLLEKADFANGTSSRSTKLAHGGVRYLAQGNLSLVNEALYERGLMLQNAPHLVSMLPFLIPSYRWWEKYYYGVGLKIYDWMARRLRLNKTTMVAKKAALKLLPNLIPKNLNGGIVYYDGQFDDTRLALSIAQTCNDKGGNLINYMQVTNLLKNFKEEVCGVTARDIENNREYKIKGKVVVNATGAFVDDILKLNSRNKAPLVKLSQGVHLVLDKKFLPGNHALMIPATADGRVLFAVPWHNHLLVGTTDTPVEEALLEPKALKSEIDFILETLRDYLASKPEHKDILSVFAGLRPLVQPSSEKGTKEISRDHKLSVSDSGLITITGGKWTTYRKMAEDTIDAAIKTGKLPQAECNTSNLKLHGYATVNGQDYLDIYGSDKKHILELTSTHPDLGERLHPDFPNIKAEVVWAVRNEMAINIADILARRLRILFLNAKIAIALAPEVGKIMAEEMNKDQTWIEEQLKEFNQLAKRYLPSPYSIKKPINNKPKIKSNI
ncbi:glycerol-3-phosphate dehydrogenase/oxidase [Gramella sp. KN1008]|uniref:glycerol-3-phosphate dehydrogenase/oxidase n=1 Tax=Gramella sp. KN1008 TaxID=2529298 RepID=UPI00103C944C|nr:glycerol-3-phosphate dehydrogenase/oxidase [Gramella sp. KN1008]TBW27098.1 glycerol-3-phosphate dehydrogenase/oxidase [Gramella sp. KN1008]